MIEGIYNLLHIPYYRALIVKDGEVIAKGIVRYKEAKQKYFRIKKHRAVFILPKITDRPPIRIKSGYLLVYDLRNAFPMKLVSDGEEETVFGVIEQDAVTASRYVSAPIDTEELHNFLEAKVTEDILADAKKEIPMWLLYLITVGVVAALVLGALYLLSKGQPPIYIDGVLYNGALPTATPTPGYVVTP